MINIPIIEEDEDAQVNIPVLDSDFDTLINLPEEKRESIYPTREEYREIYNRQQKQSLGRRAWNIAKEMPRGAYEYFSEAWGEAMADESLIKGLFNFFDGDEQRNAGGAIGGAFELGTRDVYRMGKTIFQNIRDEYSDLSEEEKFENDYQRLRENIAYNELVRPAFAKEVAKGKYQGDIKALADFLDPTIVIPGGFAPKVLAKTTRKAIKTTGAGVAVAGKTAEYLGKGVEKVASAPRNITKKIVGEKMYYATYGLTSAGLYTGNPLGFLQPGLKFAETVGKVAKVAGREVSEVSRVFATPSGHERFLFRLSTDAKVSKKTRKLASALYKSQGSKVYDILFDGLVGGLSASALQGALQFASGATDEQIGQAMGAGVALGSPVGALSGSRGSGKDLASVDADGQLTSRSNRTIKNHMAKKNDEDAIEAMKKLKKVSPTSAVLFATLDQASETAGVRINVMGNDSIKEVIEARLDEGESVPASQVPPAMYDSQTRTMYINEDKIQEGVKEATHTIAHEIGHDHIVQMIGTDPNMRKILLDDMEDSVNGKEFFFFDASGQKTESIKLNKEAQAFAEAYAKRIRSADPIQADRILEDAGLLAEEMGAESFALMFGDDPNVFAKFRPEFRQHLLNGMNKALAHFGITNPNTGAKMASNAISEATLKNKGLQNLFKNHLKAQRDQLLSRANDLEEKSNNKKTKITPKPGQTDADRFQEVFGGVGIDINRAGQFIVPDKNAFIELKQLMVEVSQDENPNYATLGKKGGAPELHPKIKEFFYKLAPDRKSAEKVLEMSDNIINSRLQSVYGARSANNKPGKTNGYNPFEFRNAVFERYELSPQVFRKGIGTKSDSIPHLKLIGYDQDKLMHNIDVLAKNGFIEKFGYKNVDDFIAQFEKESARTAGKFHEESGRINPEGRAENELMTASFGNITTKFENIKNPQLKEFLQNPENKKLIQPTMITLGMFQFSGISNSGKKGFGFQYEYIRDNYMPKAVATNKDGMRYMPKAHHGSPFTFDRFSTDSIGTGEGAQAFGYGLYFADLHGVANFYREQLVDRAVEYPKEISDRLLPEIERLQALYKQNNAETIATRNKYHEAIRGTGNLESVMDGSMKPNKLIESDELVKDLRDQVFELNKKRDELVKQIEPLVDELQKNAIPNEGKIYNVNIAPDEKEFLDWDKTLPRDQLKKILKQSVKERFVSSAYAGLRGINEGIGQDATGREFYNAISEQLGSQQKASAFLDRAGIPGVIYKDAFSRDSSSPSLSNNYVVFDDKNVEIESVQFRFMPKKADGDAFARPLEEILQRIPANERFKGNKLPGAPVLNPQGKKFLSLNLDKKIGKLHIEQRDIDHSFEKALDDSGSAGRLAVERLAEDGHIMTPPDEAHYKAVESLPIRDRFWYEISAEAMAISFPDFAPDEKAMVMDMTSATSPLADPNYNASLMLSIMSEYVLSNPSYTPAVVQKSVADVFAGEFGKQEARKVGSFGQTFKFISGLLDSPPLPTNDRQVASSFGIPDEAFGKYPVLYEVVSRYFNNMRDTINNKRGDHPDGVFESYQIQAPSWVQTRAEGKQERRKNITEEEIFEGDAYANAFKKIADTLRKNGIKVDKDKETGLPYFTKELLADQRITEILQPLAFKFRDSKFGTMEIVSLLHENGKDFAKLANESASLGIVPNLKDVEKTIQSGMKVLMNRRNVRDANGKIVKKFPSPITQLAQAMTGNKGSSGEITRIEIGKGTFEGDMSPNIRIPMDNIPADMHETFLAVLGDAYMQAAQAGSVFNATDGTPDTYSVFVKGLKIDNDGMQPFSEMLSSIGHEANISQRPNGVVIDVNPKFNDDFTTSPIDYDKLDNLVVRSFEGYDTSITGQSYDSTYIERSDYSTIIQNFKNRKRNEFAKQIRETTGFKARVAGDILRGKKTDEFETLAQIKRKRVERIRSAYDSFLRDFKSVSKDIRKSAKEFEKATGKVNEKLLKRIDREKQRLQRQGKL